MPGTRMTPSDRHKSPVSMGIFTMLGRFQTGHLDPKELHGKPQGYLGSEPV